MTIACSSAFTTSHVNFSRGISHCTLNAQSPDNDDGFGVVMTSKKLGNLVGIGAALMVAFGSLDVAIAETPEYSMVSFSATHIEQVLGSSSLLTSNNKGGNVATTGVAITNINYNGKVATTEADEYVVITNPTKSPVDISKYYVYVATTGTQGPTFTFPPGTTLRAGGSFRIYTNEVHKESGGFSYGSGKAIWNNRGGLAVLKDDQGKKIMEYKYKPTD